MEGIHSISKKTAGISRQLAAIMFADMVGYTALMQEDEQRAIMLKDRMKSVIDHLIPIHHGRIVQYYGDGTLSIFSSATEAVKCATGIQFELQKEPQVFLRIGIHSGDVCIDAESIYGDCVNLASRIEALAVPGSILISDKVYDEIKNQSTITSQYLGKYLLKNVKRPAEIYGITADHLVLPTAGQMGVKSGSDKSIAVLPFLNMSADPDNEYFSDGISEEILNALTHVDGLQVCSRSSSFTFKGKNKDVRQVGQKLGVSAVLEGSVRRSGNKVRISCQLINTTDGYRIWSDVYDGELDDIFGLQDEISHKIVNRLKENFAPPSPKEEIVKLPTQNIEAYNLYLKGRFYWNKSNPEDISKSIKAFEESIRLDPEFHLPYCMLSFCYSFMGSSGLCPRQDAFNKAKDFTLKALELNPQHAESYLSLAAIQFFQNWDFKSSEIALQKVIDLGLNTSMLHQLHGMILIANGKFDLAIEKMSQALNMDPLSLPLMSSLADAFGFARRFDEALALYDKIIELDATFRRAFEGKGVIYLAMGDYENSILHLKHYHSLIGHPLKGLSALGHAYAAGGYPDLANECLIKIQQRQLEEPGVNFDLDFAFLYAGFKDLDKVFYHLDRTYEQRMGIACTGILYCVRYPMLGEMRSDPRFQMLLKKIGLE